MEAQGNQKKSKEKFERPIEAAMPCKMGTKNRSHELQEEVLIRQKDEEFIFPRANDTAKLSGRDYEFREPTLRRE